MALDAVSLMRARVRGTPSWPGHDPETGYVGADRSDHSQKLLADGAGHTLRGLIGRAHKNKVIVALAGKLARIAWAVLRSGESYVKRDGRCGLNEIDRCGSP